MVALTNLKANRQNVLLAEQKNHKESQMKGHIAVDRKDNLQIQVTVASKDQKDRFVMQTINLAGVELKNRMKDHQINLIKQKEDQETQLKNLSVSLQASVKVKADLLTDPAEKAVTGQDVKPNQEM